MSTDPLLLSDILAGPPNDADYEAVYAQIMATERGRRFLTEYAIRERHRDTHMLVGTISRLEAAMRDDPPLQVPAAFARDLTELASAIERVEAEVAASGTPAPDGLPAAERIQGIASALRDLAHRVDAMIALVVAASPDAEPPAVDAAAAPAAAQREGAIEDEAAGEDAFDHETPAPAELSEPQARQDENFAPAVRALAALFPAPAEAGEPGREPPSEPAQPAGDEIRGHDAERLDDAAQESATDAVDTQSFDQDDVGSLLQLESAHPLLPDTPPPTGPEEDPADLFEPLPLPIASPLFTPVEAMAAAGAPAASIAGAVKPEDSKQTTHDSNIGDADRELTDVHGVAIITLSREWEEGRAEATPARASEGEAASQVFPAASPAPIFAAPASMEVKIETKSPAAPALPPPHVNVAPVTRAIPRAAPSDPLASVRALSEEELIALFS